MVTGRGAEIASIYLQAHGLRIHESIGVPGAPGTGSGHPNTRAARGDRPIHFLQLVCNSIEVLIVNIRNFYRLAKGVMNLSLSIFLGQLSRLAQLL
jgi:hypothetical protein